MEQNSPSAERQPVALQAEATTPCGVWKPVLRGAEAARCRKVLVDLLDGVRRLPSTWREKHDLPRGYPGLAVFLSYAAHIHSQRACESAAIDYLGRSLDAMPRTSMAPGLHGGFTGLAWVIEHLKGRLLDSQEDCGLDAIDWSILTTLRQDHARRSVGRHDYDLISGLVGLGVYALDRLPRPHARECLELIVDLLDRAAERVPEGVVWFTPPEMLPDSQREDFPWGYYNLGVAHGVPGIIGFLGRVHSAGVAHDVVAPLLEGAVSWLLDHENPTGLNARFPAATHPRVTDKPQWDNSRLAWCYGDPGVAAVLLGAALAVGNARWESKAVSIARNAVLRRKTGNETQDGSLCHGASGLVHIFNVFYQHTGDPQFREAVRYWLEVTYGLQRPGQGIGGFRAWEPRPDGELDWVDDPGFLNGAAGIGLALLATVSEATPEWGRSLLLPCAVGA